MSAALLHRSSSSRLAVLPVDDLRNQPVISATANIPVALKLLRRLAQQARRDPPKMTDASCRVRRESCIAAPTRLHRSIGASCRVHRESCITTSVPHVACIGRAASKRRRSCIAAPVPPVACVGRVALQRRRGCIAAPVPPVACVGSCRAASTRLHRSRSTARRTPSD